MGGCAHVRVVGLYECVCPCFQRSSDASPGSEFLQREGRDQAALLRGRQGEGEDFFLCLRLSTWPLCARVASTRGFGEQAQLAAHLLPSQLVARQTCTEPGSGAAEYPPHVTWHTS
jgi:hypothetical protein